MDIKYIDGNKAQLESKAILLCLLFEDFYKKNVKKT